MAVPAHSRGLGIPSFAGDAACPNLEDQAAIWKLLKPEEIGVQLTEGFMTDPEARVSALVIHHPDCTYFSVGEAAEP
jgi:5-methyltetrahydrofolate--homocysteine methyltransferase